MTVSENRSSLHIVYENITLNLLKLVNEMIDCSFGSEAELNTHSEKILIAVDILSYSLNGE